MTENTEWAAFFNGHAPDYDDNCFTKNTIAEVDFLLDVLELPPGASILDVGCGTGRHAVELAGRGYEITGLDISTGMLEQAKQRATAAHVHVAWRQADATDFSFERTFDGVICLCEGAFGLLGGRDDPIQQPLAILRNVAGAMQLGAKCLFTVLNGFAIVRRYAQTDVAQGVFDPMGLTERSECANDATSPLRERGFVPTELMLLFDLAGLRLLEIWGGTAGNWGKRPIDLDEIEIMILSERPTS